MHIERKEKGVDKKKIDLLDVSKEVKEVLLKAKSIIVPRNKEHLLELALGGAQSDSYTVSYNGVEEVTITKCKNGAAVNYVEPYMRRREPECMVIADEKPTDKETYKERFGKEFTELQKETMEWLADQELILMPFIVGDREYGCPAVLIGPANAGFFAAGLADLQCLIPADEWTEVIKPRSILYLAPPFRHSHFDGKQVVVHNRLDYVHEVYAYNLYPGPSAKKGMYGVLLNIGEQEGWVTNHASTVKLTTAYDNTLILMHEGASGGGKSEMIEEVHREVSGKVLLAENSITGEQLRLSIKDPCEIHPVTDDMALSHVDFEKDRDKLVVKDAEAGWFLRMNHITHYGVSPQHEKLSIHPKEPLIFMNMDAVPNSTCLIWEHIMDEPGKPCPNPRVIVPRHLIPDIVSDTVAVDVRSFGVRTPLCTKENPTYGIIGLVHVLPASLAWLWRLVAPRGHDNPSIVQKEGMASEGVGSYWPFATGRKVDQANLLLKQIMDTPRTRYVLIPNQNIGAYKTGFSPQWVVREYLARWGSAKFRPDQIQESRSPLLGYSLKKLKMNDTQIPPGLLQVDRQVEVGEEGYDIGAKILVDFFKKELKEFLVPGLDPFGAKIIEAFMNDSPLEEFVKLTPMD
jgi:hypothetical protein